MADLVDYLRDKLDHADDQPALTVVRWGEIASGGLRVVLWPEEWSCCVCLTSGPRDEANRAAWDHLDTHRPKPKKRRWRR